MSDKDGGSAFPHKRPLTDAEVQRIRTADGRDDLGLPDGLESGMTLRDYFAGAALVIFSDPRVLVELRNEARDRGENESALFAKAVYEIADAMIAERAK